MESKPLGLDSSSLQINWGVRYGFILLVFFSPLFQIISRKLLRFTLSRVANYCVSTPIGVVWGGKFRPQVSPGAIQIQPLSGLIII
jgi:hypothetical protein